MSMRVQMAPMRWIAVAMVGLAAACGGADEAAKAPVESGAEGGQSSALTPEAMRFMRIDSSTPLNLVRQAAEAGQPQAMFVLGERYYAGAGLLRSPEAAAQWWLKAAENGHRLAQFNIGAMYIKGDGIAQSGAEGVRWLRAAADSGHAEAQSALGRQYLAGANVTKDEAAAVRWLQTAVEGGSRSAMKHLAVLYWHGRAGLQKDPERTFDLFRQAADPGDPDSLLNLGYCYRDGRGTTADPYAAFVFLNAALSAGNQDVEVRARQALDDLWGRIRPEQVISGQKLSAQLMNGQVSVANLVRRFSPEEPAIY